jgi:hypothetical protein
VTRLGDFSLIGQLFNFDWAIFRLSGNCLLLDWAIVSLCKGKLFTFGRFLKIAEVAQIFG